MADVNQLRKQLAELEAADTSAMSDHERYVNVRTRQALADEIREAERYQRGMRGSRVDAE